MIDFVTVKVLGSLQPFCYLISFMFFSGVYLLHFEYRQLVTEKSINM